MNVIEKKAKRMSWYLHDRLVTLAAKYKISEGDLNTFKKAMDETAEDWFTEDMLGDAIRLGRIKEEVKKPLSKQDLAALLAKVRIEIKNMLEFNPGYGYETMKKYADLHGYPCEKEDADAPFYTETFLYLVLGKEDARSVLYPMQQLAEMLGVKAGKEEEDA